MPRATIIKQAGRAGAWDKVTDESYLLLTVNTTNWWDLRIRWDYNSENDIVGDDLGPESFDFDFRVGGTGGWMPILDNQPLTRNDAWHEFSYNLWLISAIENQPIVEFCVRDLQQGTESGGNFKIDNLEADGNNFQYHIALNAQRRRAVAWRAVAYRIHL